MSENIFRFKFSEGILNKMIYFSQVHKYDSKEDFKDSWEEWKLLNRDIINEENDRLKSLGYKGDIENKIYKSIKYYYCKKTDKKNEVKKRKDYTVIDKKYLKHIDYHIENNRNVKPSELYERYKRTNSYNDLFNSLQIFSLNKEDIEFKIKKTYKNRYFLIINKT